VGVLKTETPVEEAITLLLFFEIMSALLWRRNLMQIRCTPFASNVVHFFFVHGVSSPNDEVVGGCLVGWSVRPVDRLTEHSQTNQKIACSVVLL
jgi:hypothetical protein